MTSKIDPAIIEALSLDESANMASYGGSGESPSCIFR